jgi:oxygen-independent coproporphyrinogen-3 oxidase
MTQEKYQVADFEKYFAQSWPKFINWIEQNNYRLGKVQTIYIGGGTPSLWKSGMDFLKPYIDQCSNRISEFTLEVDPGAWNEESLQAWSTIGVNRFSVGLQTLNANLLGHLGRSHALSDSIDLLEYMKASKRNFSADFLLGIPYGEKTRDVQSELEQAIHYGAEHISAYILTVGKNYPLYSQIPSEEWIEREFLSTHTYLTEKGFDHYEVSNYAKKGKHSLHNQNYWAHQPMGAIGASGVGFLPTGKTGQRLKWLPGWDHKFHIEHLDENDLALEKLYLTLRQSRPFSIKSVIGNEAKIDRYDDLLQAWVSKGYMMSYDSKRFGITAQGMVILDELMNQWFTCEK